MDAKQFPNMTAVRKAICTLKQSDTLRYKLEKFGATLMPARAGVCGFTVFCYTPSTVSLNDEYDLSTFVKALVANL